MTSLARKTNVETVFDIRWFASTTKIWYTFLHVELMWAVWTWNTRNYICFVSKLKGSSEGSYRGQETAGDQIPYRISRNNSGRCLRERKISLDFPISHPRPYQGVLTVYPPILALALDIVEADIKDIQVDESNEVCVQVDEKVIDISTCEIDTQKLVSTP